MAILALDSSFRNLYLTLLKEENFFSDCLKRDPGSTNELSSQVAPFLSQYLLNLSELRLIVWGSGPGSFTGLRSGLAFLKGLSFGLRVPIRKVGSLQGYAQSVANPQDKYLVSFADAGRQDLFFSAYRAKKSSTDSILEELVAPRIISPEGELDQILRNLNQAVPGFEASQVRCVAVGDGAEKVQDRFRETVAAANVSQALLKIALAANSDPSSWQYSLEELQSIQPDYLRAVNAQTISERAATRRSKNVVVEMVRGLK